MGLFAAVYLLFLFAILVAGGFIVFHLLRYSIDQTIAKRTVAVFIIITLIMIAMNIIFFMQIPFNDFTGGSLYTVPRF